MLYSVVVEQQLNQDTRHQIAQKLGLMLRVSAAQIDTQLQHGPLTVEADLTLAEAREKQGRYVRQGIAAHILDEQGIWVESTSAAPASPATTTPAQASVDLFDEDIQSALGTLDFEQMMAQLADSGPNVGEVVRPENLTPTDEEIGASVNQLRDQLAPPQTPPATESRSPAQTSGGWDAILGTSTSPTSTSPSVPSQPAEPPVTSPASFGFGAEPSQPIQTPATPTRPQNPAAQSDGWGALGFGGSAPLEAEPEPVLPKVPAAQPTPMDFGAEQVNAPQSVHDAVEIAQNRQFDADQLEQAFIEKPKAESAAPYAPKQDGYSDRPPHSVEIATLLAVFAPGSAQIYNGQPKQAWHYGTWFFLILPWINGVRDARKQAQKIATHHAPMPNDGTLASALKYSGIWYVIVIFITVFFSVSISKLVANLNKKPNVELHSPFLVNASIEGTQLIAAKAVDRATHILRSKESEAQKDKMSPEERAHRLFMISLPSCQIRNLAVCKASMERVTQIQSTHPYAFKIQVWASMQLKGAKVSPMPSVGELKPLNAFDKDMDSAPDMGTVNDATKDLSQGDDSSTQDMSAD